ncbi:alpha/beta hydrolase [bacterium]|nr:alpha/beta hydrolase [bacterium]
MLAIVAYSLLALLILIIILFGAFTWFVLKTHFGNIERGLEAKPLFLADAGEPVADAVSLELRTADGRNVAGSYLNHTGGVRRGVILFFHEYGATRWMADPYVGYLRPLGFDVLTIDFCGSGESPAVKGYESFQWPTQHELSDAKAALAYVKSRDDLTNVPIGVFGVSKGGGVAIALAAEDAAIRGIVTDGAFPVHRMIIHFSMQFIEIFSTSQWIYRYLPRWYYAMVVELAIKRIERKKHVHYLSIERAMKVISGRPILMINGQKDNYIKSDLIAELLAGISEPKELWIVPKAKHNRCLEREGENYRKKVSEFFLNAFPA